MIQINLKRKKGNNSVVFGILEIPRFDFKCTTMELKDGQDLVYKQNCCLPVGNYLLDRCIAEGSAFFPRLKRKPLGFAVKPRFELTNLSYPQLNTGMIAVGMINDDFSLKENYELSAKFKEVFTQVFLSGETVVLCIFKGNYYQHTDMSYEEVKQNEAASFLDDWKDDEEEFGHGEQTELENDGQQ